VTTPEPGIGCRPLAAGFAALVVFAAAAVAVGLALALGTDPAPWAERVGFALYAAGAPVSGLFAAIAGELPLAPLTDVVVWVLAAAGATRWADRRSVPPTKPLLTVMVAALVYGAVVGSFLERA
jgi:hypothetical protein